MFVPFYIKYMLDSLSTQNDIDNFNIVEKILVQVAR